MRVRIPHLTEHDADTIADQLERLTQPTRIRKVKLSEPRTPRKTRRRKAA